MIGERSTTEDNSIPVHSGTKMSPLAYVSPRPQYNDTSEANARLIAAAPELLAALQYFATQLPGIIRQCCPQGVPMEVADAVDAARAAIQKAQGGTEVLPVARTEGRVTT